MSHRCVSEGLLIPGGGRLRCFDGESLISGVEGLVGGWVGGYSCCTPSRNGFRRVPTVVPTPKHFEGNNPHPTRDSGVSYKSEIGDCPRPLVGR